MRAHMAMMWLVVVGCAGCAADFGANPSTRCNETSLCPLPETCYRGFCVQGRELEVDGSLSQIREVEAGLVTPDTATKGEGGTAPVLADAQTPAAPAPRVNNDGGATPVTNDAGPTLAVPTSPADAGEPVPGPPTTPAPTAPVVDPTQVSPAPTAPEPTPTTPVTPPPTTPPPTTPPPTTPPPTTAAPTTPTTPEPTPPVTPTPVIDAGGSEPSVPTPTPTPSTPPTAEPEQSSPLLPCLAVCFTRSSLCLTCLAESINNDPSVCAERRVRGDRELRELCDWLCTRAECGGAR